MRLSQSVQIATGAFKATLSSLRRPAIWFPFLIIALVQVLVLLLLVSFHRPLAQQLGVPLVELLGGEPATPYPVFYLALPMMFGRASLVISVLIASVALGAATLLFARSFGFQGRSAPWPTAFRRSPTLIILTVLLVGILMGLGFLRLSLPETLQYSRAGRWGIRGADLALLIVIQCFVVYTTAWVMLHGHSVWSALRDSIRVARRTLLPTLLVVGIPLILQFPLSYATGRADFFVAKFDPEIVTLLLATKLVGDLLMTFIIVGATTRLFLWRMEAAA
jgi:predicted small integral membrane protein